MSAELLSWHPRTTFALAVVVALLELVHPAWLDGNVAEGVTAAGGVWVPLHVGLLIGYALLTWCLWHAPRVRTHAVGRFALLVFAVANTVFLAVDGLIVGLRAPTDPAGVDELWASAGITLLANIAGAAWCLALLSLGADRYPLRLDRPIVLLLALTWLAFILTATPLAPSPLVSRALAIATGAWLVYRAGPVGLPTALLVFGAVLRQHVGPEAALGVVCVAAALGLPSGSDTR